MGDSADPRLAGVPSPTPVATPMTVATPGAPAAPAAAARRDTPSTNADLARRRQAAIPRGIANSLAVYAERAANAELWDVEGRRYLDFASGIAVLNTGHLHPRVQAAIAAQLARFSHACFQVTPYEGYVALAERLNAIAPGPGPWKTLFLTTGAEAVENAVKIARYHTRRSGVIAFSGGFHGRTLACIALTGKVQPYKAGFGPMMPEVYHAPYPMPYHGIDVDDAFAALEQLFKADVDPQRIAAIIVEPVLGEGGFYIAPPAFLQRLRALCDTHGIVLIVDEIQTGFARTGRMFAIEHAGRRPRPDDRRQEHRRRRAAIGRHRSRRPDGCAAAGRPRRHLRRLAARLRRGPRRARRHRRGTPGRALGTTSARVMTARLRDLQSRWPCIGDVRGLGAMVAMELVARSRPAAAGCGPDPRPGAGGRTSRADPAVLRRVFERHPVAGAADDFGCASGRGAGNT